MNLGLGIAVKYRREDPLRLADLILADLIFSPLVQLVLNFSSRR